MRSLPAALALALAASACGQRGPLYLRESPPPGVKPEKAERFKPVPYPREQSEQK